MNKPKVAYFCAEIGLDETIKTYSGGLGILAGDTIKAMADLKVPLCAVTLLYKDGFFKQRINDNNLQEELDDPWEYKTILQDTGIETQITLFETPITIKIWKYEYSSEVGDVVPIYFLDTHCESNPDWAKELTDHLYVGDRMLQELVLGFGGYEALKALEHPIEKYHMNEGHSAFLTLKLYQELGEKNGFDDGQVKEHCVFTTHTPIPAGHDKFEYDDFYRALQGQEYLIPWHIKKLAGEYKLNMTKLALSLSSFSNAVSLKHKEVTQKMFPNSTIDAITNGIHVNSWASPEMKELFDNYLPQWRYDNTVLKDIFKVPNSEIYKAHTQAKQRLISYVNKHTIVDTTLDTSVLTIGFARRFIEYKDAELIFSNMDYLKSMGKKVQFIFAGKSHKNDGVGKDIMKRIIEKAKLLEEDISIAFVENYDIYLAKLLVSGCDLWLNTPIPPNEASGTSGMKASVNGCMHFSRLDGWAIESFQKNGGGFPIYEYPDFVTALEFKIIPMFYAQNKTSWIEEMKLAIGNSGSYFNTHRMAKEYIEKAYRL